jgi:hypothetical protein
VFFGFDQGAEQIGVGIESSFSFTPPGGRVHVPLHESDAMKHIGSIVASAACEADGTIVLDLDDGTGLRFFEDDVPYESYSIFLPDGRQIIV